jgi:hypothetical protein
VLTVEIKIATIQNSPPLHASNGRQSLTNTKPIPTTTSTRASAHTMGSDVEGSPIGSEANSAVEDVAAVAVRAEEESLSGSHRNSHSAAKSTNANSAKNSNKKSTKKNSKNNKNTAKSNSNEGEISTPIVDKAALGGEAPPQDKKTSKKRSKRKSGGSNRKSRKSGSKISSVRSSNDADQDPNACSDKGSSLKSKRSGKHSNGSRTTKGSKIKRKESPSSSSSTATSPSGSDAEGVENECTPPPAASAAGAGRVRIEEEGQVVTEAGEQVGDVELTASDTATKKAKQKKNKQRKQKSVRINTIGLTRARSVKFEERRNGLDVAVLWVCGVHVCGYVPFDCDVAK